MSPWLRALRRRGAAGRSQPAPRPVAAPAAVREPPAPAPAPLGARVRTLVDTVRPLSQAPKTPEEIEAGTAAQNPEGTVPADLLRRILAGDDEPAQDLTAVQLRTLADFFMLAPAYFLGSDAEVEMIDAGLEYLRLVRDPATAGVPYLCTRGGPVDAALLRAHSQLMRDLPAILADPEAHGAVTFHPSRGTAEVHMHPGPDAQDQTPTAAPLPSPPSDR